MALVLRVIGSAAVGKIDQFEFFAGEDRTLKLQVFDSESKSSHPIPTGATKALSLAATPNDLEFDDGDIEVDDDDASIFTVELDDDDTGKLITGDVKLEYTIAAVTRVANGATLLKKLLVVV